MDDNFEERFGKIIGRGAQAVVYADGKYAVKLYREGYPKRNVFSEAYIMAGLEVMNFPAPRVYEVFITEGRYGLRMDVVKGELMKNGLQDEKTFTETMDALIELQCRLQKTENTEWLPDIKARMRDDLLLNNSLEDDTRNKALEMLAGLPDGTALCHCDFHAENVFFDGTNFTIIDLLQMSKGDPAADAACSYAAYSFVDKGLADYYIKRYCEISGISKECVFNWLPVYAATVKGQVPVAYAPVVEGFLTVAI